MGTHRYVSCWKERGTRVVNGSHDQHIYTRLRKLRLPVLSATRPNARDRQCVRVSASSHPHMPERCSSVHTLVVSSHVSRTFTRWSSVHTLVVSSHVSRTFIHWSSVHTLVVLYMLVVCSHIGRQFTR